MLKLLQKISDALQVVLCVILFVPAIIILGPYTRIRRIWKKMIGRKPSVLWAPVPIMNIRHNSRAMEQRGYDSKTLVYKPYHINQAGFFDYNLERYVQQRWLIPFLPFFVAIWAGFRFDVFHCYFDGLFFYSNHWLVKAEF